MQFPKPKELKMKSYSDFRESKAKLIELFNLKIL